MSWSEDGIVRKLSHKEQRELKKLAENQIKRERELVKSKTFETFFNLILK